MSSRPMLVEARDVTRVTAEALTMHNPEINLRVTISRGPATMRRRPVWVLITPADLKVILANPDAKAIIRQALNDPEER